MSNVMSRLRAFCLLSPSEFDRLVRSAPRRYKVYEIPKRTPGQTRTIAQPSREVKTLQRWLIANCLQDLPVHEAAMAYRSGRSIYDNAHRHVNSRFLLKLDFKDFFPSIKAQDFIHYLSRHMPHVTAGEAELLACILFWRRKGTSDLRLSIGAPSSPLVSNLLMYDFDTRLAIECERLGVTYTRYADDISLSARDSNLLARIEPFVGKLCDFIESPRLVLNETKTVRVSRRTSRRVTGLVLTPEGQVSLGRENKRRIRAMVHHFAEGRLTEEEKLYLQGMLAYANSVEPDFIARLIRHYGVDTIARLQTQFRG